MEQQVVHRLNVFGEKSHGASSFRLWNAFLSPLNAHNRRQFRSASERIPRDQTALKRVDGDSVRRTPAGGNPCAHSRDFGLWGSQFGAMPAALMTTALDSVSAFRKASNSAGLNGIGSAPSAFRRCRM